MSKPTGPSDTPSRQRHTKTGGRSGGRIRGRVGVPRLLSKGHAHTSDKDYNRKNRNQYTEQDYD